MVKGILPKYRKEGMIELLNWRDKGFFGKKENISIHELADKGAEWGLFLSDSNTPLSAKTIEIELGEIWRGEHLQKVMEKKSKNKNKDKKKYNLLYEFGRLVKDVQPDIVTMENVPAIASFKLQSVLGDFVNTLEAEGYYVSYHVVYCPDYGIPQTRRRLVLLASKLGEIELISPTHQKDNYVTVGDVISNLPPLQAGEECPTDKLHRCRALSALNMRRIEATPYGGSWRDWPEELMLNCHKKEGGKSFGSVYGRMTWEEPAPTMTTLCTGIGNGRFGHPVQNRAISAREAALFQTFPIKYKFFPNEQEVSLVKASRYIGNAVPPKLGEVIAESIKKHIRTHK